METATFTVRTGGRPVVHDVTDPCAERARESGGDGLVHVFVPHATAGLALIETGSGSEPDLLAVLESLLPGDDRWRHAHGSPGHGRSHVLPAFVAPSLVLAMQDGRLLMGRWQSICLVDLNVDNAERTVRVSVLRG